MIFELKVKDSDDIHLIVCALSAYHTQIHPTNSSKKDVERLIQIFLKMSGGD
jgi:hypothetical protein